MNRTKWLAARSLAVRSIAVLLIGSQVQLGVAQSAGPPMLPAGAAPSERPAQSASPPNIAQLDAVRRGQKVFVANAGITPFYGGEGNQRADGAYSTLYATLQAWGYYQLVSSPGEADLIFAVNAGDPPDVKEVPHDTIDDRPDQIGPIPSFDLQGINHPVIHLTVTDAHTRTQVWAGSAVASPQRKVKEEQTFAQAMSDVVNQFRLAEKLPDAPPIASAAPVAPLPALMLGAQIVYVPPGSDQGAVDVMDESALRAAVASSAGFTLADQPGQARVILQVETVWHTYNYTKLEKVKGRAQTEQRTGSYKRLSAIDAATGVTVWSVAMTTGSLKPREAMTSLLAAYKKAAAMTLTADESESLTHKKQDRKAIKGIAIVFAGMAALAVGLVFALRTHASTAPPAGYKYP